MHGKCRSSCGHNFPLSARSYITSLEENAAEGTKLEFEGGLDIVEDLDKVGLYHDTILDPCLPLGLGFSCVIAKTHLI